MKKGIGFVLSILLSASFALCGCDYKPPSSKEDPSPVVSYVVSYADSYVALDVGDSFSPEITFTANGEDADLSALAFSSDDSDCASVNDSGLITAESAGVATITASIGEDENCVYDELVVIVADEGNSQTPEVPTTAPIYDISYANSYVELEVGQWVTPSISYTIDGQSQDPNALAYSSDNEACALVEDSGRILAVAKGYATITAAKWTGTTRVHDSIFVIVDSTATEPPADNPPSQTPISYQLDYANTYIELEIGQTATPLLTFTADGTDADKTLLSYASDNTACASVNANGQITATAKGYATVTVFYGAGTMFVSDTIVIAVIDPKPVEPFVVTEGSNGVDFIIDYPSGKDINVLQITDTQTIDYYGMRNTTRQNQIRNAFFSNNMSKDHDVRAWRYVDEAVEKSNPDLIIATGDNIYGETDDDGEQWQDFISVMDSYEVPWLTVFGNHDNESEKGVNWQIDQLMASEYCVFDRGSVTGNSNYTVLISSGGEAKYLFVMMDTNGCREIPENPGEGILSTNKDLAYIRQSAGFADDQITWLENSVTSAYGRYGEVPMIVWQHVAVAEAWNAMRDLYGISESSQISASNPFNLNDPNGPYFNKYPENFGIAMTLATTTYTYVERLWPLLKNLGCKGMFFGHEHDIATSIVYGGIRLTYGLKTGTYAYHDKNILGGTKVTLDVSEKTFVVTYLYSDFAYSTNQA